MESKAQKAALAAIKKRKEDIMREIGIWGLDGPLSQNWIMKHTSKIGEMIKEYGLEDRLLNDTIEEICNVRLSQNGFKFKSFMLPF